MVDFSSFSTVNIAAPVVVVVLAAVAVVVVMVVVVGISSMSSLRRTNASLAENKRRTVSWNDG